jgi:hypothetical protein
MTTPAPKGNDQFAISMRDPVSAFALWGACSPIVVAPLLLFAALSLVAPINVLVAWPWTKRFTDIFTNHLPWLGNHALSTTYPQVALLIACMTLCLLFWTSLFFFVYSIVNYPKMIRNQRIQKTLTWWKALLIAALAPPFVYLVIVAAFAIPGDPSWANGFTTGSRLGLIFLSVCLAYPGGLVLGGIPGSLRLLINLDLKKE